MGEDVLMLDDVYGDVLVFVCDVFILLVWCFSVSIMGSVCVDFFVVVTEIWERVVADEDIERIM